MQWFDIPDAVMDSVIATPRYPKPRQQVGDGSPNIIAAWGGAAWDYVNQRMLITGGGHGDAHECETGIYALDANMLAFKRAVDRAPLSAVQSWDFSANALSSTSRGNATNTPLLNGTPASVHTYDGLVWLPPGTPGAGALAGGLFYPGTARTVVNLDNGNYATTHWRTPLKAVEDWSYCTAVVDGNVIYGPHESYYFFKYDLRGSEATDWSPKSFGKMTKNYATSGIAFPYSNRTWVCLLERRQQVSFTGTGIVRLRHGDAIDLNATDWTNYHEPIVLTSADGAHLDFSTLALTDNGALSNAGMHYDHPAECIWVQANPRGSALYRITGLAGQRWSVERIATNGALHDAGHGTWGRFRVAVLAGAKVALRVSATTDPLQVMRLS
jgi:hypothetical protein